MRNNYPMEDQHIRSDHQMKGTMPLDQECLRHHCEDLVGLSFSFTVFSPITFILYTYLGSGSHFRL